MRFSIQSVVALAGLVSASPRWPEAHPWIPAGPNDFRGPCPMMNTLANHNFLPHDGRNLTRAAIVKGLGNGLNFDPTLASLMFDMAIVANPAENATFFTLDHLNRHNVLEHDASLSRTDSYFGSNHIFNATIFEQSRAFWTNSTLTADMLANSKLARQVVSKAFNPTYTFTENTEQFSLGEIAAPIIAFGDIDSATVPKNLVEYFFLNERLPTELGWNAKNQTITLQDVTTVSAIIGKAASLITGTGNATGSVHGKRADLHAGLKF
ncbi:Chloroperoxidase [Aspergillus varians]